MILTTAGLAALQLKGEGSVTILAMPIWLDILAIVVAALGGALFAVIGVERTLNAG